MLKEEILGGLKSALNRGESLKSAMMSFYNSGYKKEDIEASAKALYQEPLIQQPIQTKEIIKQKKELNSIQQVSSYGEKTAPELNKQIQSPSLKPVQAISNPIQQKPLQQVSDYGQKTSSKWKWPLFILVFFLFALLGVLVGIFAFP